MKASRSLAELVQRIEAIEGGRSGPVGGCGLATGWPHPQASHLTLGSLHEMIGIGAGSRAAGGRWTPPLFILGHLARCAVECDNDRSVVWVGRRIHPDLAALRPDATRNLLQRSLFINVDDVDSRIWAIDLALRSPAVSMVIADGRGVAMAQSRRLQLAAQSQGALAILARPPWELKAHSCAATRWTVGRARSHSQERGPRWVVTCVRCKGVQRVSAMEADSSTLQLERCRETGRVRVATNVRNRPDQATAV